MGNKGGRVALTSFASMVKLYPQGKDVFHRLSTELRGMWKMDRKDMPKDEDDAWESLGEVVARLIDKMLRKDAA